MKQALLKGATEKQLKAGFRSWAEEMLRGKVAEIGHGYYHVSLFQENWFKVEKETEKAVQIEVEVDRCDGEYDTVWSIWMPKSAFEKIVEE